MKWQESNSSFSRTCFAARLCQALDLLNMENVCYLCGMPVTEDVSTDDHAVPKQLISRAQPKAKGFDYGGVLPTHAECNNHFGPESTA